MASSKFSTSSWSEQNKTEPEQTLESKENQVTRRRSEAEQSRELKTLISSKCSKAEVLSDVGAAVLGGNAA